MKFCRMCGQELVREEDRFCANCGSDQWVVEEPPAPKAVSEPQVVAAPAPAPAAPTTQTPWAPVAPASTAPAYSMAAPQSTGTALLLASGIVLLAALLIKFLFEQFAANVLSLINISYFDIMYPFYMANVFVGLLPVIGFILMALAGFSLARKLKQFPATKTWPLLVGIGALIGAVAWLISAVGNSYLYSLLVYNLTSQNLEAALLTKILYIGFCVLAFCAAVILFIAALRAKSPSNKPAIAGIVAAILLALYPIISLLFNYVIYPALFSSWLASGANYDALSIAITLGTSLLFIPLLAFAIFQIIFFAKIAKQLRLSSVR